MRKTFANLTRMAAFGLIALLIGGPVSADTSNENIKMTQIADGVYSFKFYVHRNMIVVTDDGVILSDPMGVKGAEALNAALAELTEQPVKYVIYSHNHWDHIAGAGVFKDQGATIVQHELGAKGTKENPDVAAPDMIWSGDRQDITLGGRTIELHYVGQSHGDGMTVMLLPEAKILHAVDIVTPDRIAFTVMPGSFPSKWIEALKKVEALEFDRVIPGHGMSDAPGSAVTEEREYLQDLKVSIATAVKATKNAFAFSEITELVQAELRPKYGEWAHFDDWMTMNIMRMTFENRMGW